MSETQTDKTPPQPVIATDAELIRENEMLKAKIKVREDQLTQAIKIANRANEIQAAKDAAEKQDLTDRIIVDSDRKMSADELKDKTLSELKLIHTVLQKSLDHTFASVAAYQAEQDRKVKPQLTAGYFDSKTQSWKGGL
jgi:hypothetical protein